MWVSAVPRQGPSRKLAGSLLIVFLAAGGTGLALSGMTGGPEPTPPQPSPAAAPAGFHRFEGESGSGGGAGALGRVGSAPADVPPALAPSAPVQLRIPAIEVTAALIDLGVDEQGEVEVPPLDQADDAGWYAHGATPGELGNAVIIGHVDTREHGPAVFFALGKLRPGDRIEVRRTDDSLVAFRVDGVASFPKRDFPTELVYGPSPVPGLRLITCGGEFDRSVRDYLDNVVVFATLAAS